MSRSIASLSPGLNKALSQQASRKSKVLIVDLKGLTPDPLVLHIPC